MLRKYSDYICYDDILAHDIGKKVIVEGVGVFVVIVWFEVFLREEEYSHSQTSLSHCGICFKKINISPQILDTFEINLKEKKKTKPKNTHNPL